MSALVAQAAAAFAPPPAGTPIEKRLHRLEVAMQVVMMTLAASSPAPPENTPTRPVRRRHLYLVTDTPAED